MASTMTAEQSRRMKNAQSSIVETVARIKEHGWILEEQHAEALELQALRMFILGIVQDGLMSMDEVNCRIVEQKAAELERQFQEQCTKKAEERKDNILVLPSRMRSS